MRIHRLFDGDPLRPVSAPNGLTYPVSALGPREGELAKTTVHGKVHAWAMDVDDEMKTRRVLRVLFENEELYGHGRQRILADL